MRNEQRYSEFLKGRFVPATHTLNVKGVKGLRAPLRHPETAFSNGCLSWMSKKGRGRSIETTVDVELVKSDFIYIFDNSLMDLCSELPDLNVEERLDNFHCEALQSGRSQEGIQGIQRK